MLERASGSHVHGEKTGGNAVYVSVEKEDAGESSQSYAHFERDDLQSLIRAAKTSEAVL